MTFVLATERKDIRNHWQGAIGNGASVFVAERWRALEEYIETHTPEMILLHHDLPGLGGIRGVHWLRHYYPEMKLLVLSDAPSDDEGIAVLRMGAHGYINSRAHPRLLQQAIEMILLGEIWVGRELMQKMITGLASGRSDSRPLRSPLLANLTDREREIAGHVANGASNKVIANDMGITERTVKAHLTSIFAKTGLHDRLRLALEVRQSDPGHPLHRTG